MKVNRVYQIVVKHDAELDRIMFDSARIYNQSLYQLRQAYFGCVKNKKPIRTPSYIQLYHIVKNHESYQVETETHIKQAAIKQAFDSWKSFIKASVSYSKDSSRFKGKPKIPHYIDQALFKAEVDKQFLNKKNLNSNQVRLPKTSYIVTLPENNFLKKATPGAIHDLDRVNRAYNNIKGESFEKYAGGGESISNVLKKYFNHITIQDNISLLMEKEVSFDNHKHAEHIFLIIMESLSEYHLSHEFEESGISKSMYKLINSENGLKVPVFIQNGYGTIETLDLMVTGLYSTYFPVSEMTSKIPCFDSSTGKIFKKLGYDTSFYYFGSSAWRKIGNYVLSQGFNQSYAMENMKNKRRSTWGILDKDGFEFIYDEIKNHKGKTFNMILSTSNHPPYDIDITDYNIDTKNIETFLDEKYPKEKRYSGINSQILSVTAYSIESVTDFIEKTYKKYPKSLFIITGDHFDRIHPNPVRDIYTTTSIPLIMYGYGVKDVKLKYEAASHKDIVPTIVEMNAPLGFKYHSFGDSFITYDNNSLIDYERIAIGAQSIANGRFIYNGEKLEYFNGVKKEKNDINTAKEYINKRNYGRAISWYIVNKGYEIK